MEATHPVEEPSSPAVALPVVSLHGTPGNAQVTSGAQFEVEGTFRSVDAPRSRVIIKVVDASGRGERIMAEGTVPVEQGEGGSHSFRGTVGAPTKAGRYALEAWHAGERVGENSLRVN